MNVGWKCRLVCGAVVLTACGGDEEGSPGVAETTLEAWRAYCVATFTEDYAVRDVFDDPMFTARVGEEYVIASFDFDDGATLVYLAPAGPETFPVAATDTGLPFVSNCQAGSTTDYYAVFSSVTIHAEEALSTPLCQLSAGVARPRDTTRQAGYSATSFNFAGPTTYEIFLNVFSADCGGAERGYVSVPQTNLFGTTTWLAPIITILGPA